MFQLSLRDSLSFKQPTKQSKIGAIMSPDSTFRLISWNYFKLNGESVCFTLLQLKPIKDTCLIYLFTPSYYNKSHKNPYTSNFIPAALYYQIIPTLVNNKKYYLLLGMNPESILIQSKSIETFYFNEKKIPTMGAPILHINNKIESRFEFCYSAKVRMSIKYDIQKQTIIIDHLSPEKPFFTGQYEYYGPDGSFDALVFKDKIWQYVSDYNLYNMRQKNN